MDYEILMDRAKYNECMKPYMTGGGPDRKIRFCIGAKVCSGKVESEEQARELCLSQPTTPTTPRKRSGKTDYPALAACLAGTIELAGLTSANVKEQLETALAQCMASKGKAEKLDKRSITYNRFMRTCMKEELGGVEKPFQKSQREINICNKKWRAFKLALEGVTSEGETLSMQERALAKSPEERTKSEMFWASGLDPSKFKGATMYF